MSSRIGVYRVVDVNTNRACEALRVMEDTARLVLDDRELALAIKSARHDLSHALAALDARVANRDTPADVGTTISTPQETQPRSLSELATAAGKRLGEALRVLEEYSKVVGGQSPDGEPLSPVIEAIRYRGYEWTRRLDGALATGRARQWRVCVIISEALCPGGDWWRVVEAVVQRDRDGEPLADCIQLREKSLGDRELLSRAHKLVAYCKPRGVSTIINDRPDIALLASADGVHDGQEDLTCGDIRRVAGRALLVGVSTSNLSEAEAAIRDGADYCGVGPVFATATKHKPLIAGPGYVREFTSTHPHTAHLAIGGITPGNIAQAVEAGAQGVAVSSIVCQADDPAGMVGALRRAWAPRDAAVGAS